VEPSRVFNSLLTGFGPTTPSKGALHICRDGLSDQIKAIERAPNADCARIILFGEFEGQHYYWTNEQYKVVCDRPLAAGKRPTGRPALIN
jgi:hypothetical protein